MNSIVEAVFAHAAEPERSGRFCLTDAKRRITYADARTLIRKVSGRLLESGLRRDSRVMLFCSQDVRFMVTMLACQYAGIVPVPVEKGASAERMKTIADESEAVCFIGRTVPPDSVKTAFLPYDKLFRDIAYAPEADLPFPGSDDVAEILFTTGTTGKPKGIILAHRSNRAIAENVIDGVRMEPDNVEIIPMPLSHSHGLRRTYANLYNGSSVVLIDGVLRIKQFFDMIETYDVTSIDISPAILSMLFRLSKDRLSQYQDQIRYVQLGSAPLPEENKERLASCLPRTRLYNFYGTTEAGCTCIIDFNAHNGKQYCIGKPAKNASFLFTDEHRIPIDATPENPGFLATAGLQNMVGYLNAPELTAEVCQNGYIYTNDLGYQDAEGNIYCLGRRDDVINCGGIKISPEEIETEVLKHPDVADCACVPMPDDIQGQVPKLFLALKDPAAPFDRKAFLAFLREALDRNKQPKDIEIIDRIPRTFNGKIERKKLLRRDESQTDK